MRYGYTKVACAFSKARGAWMLAKCRGSSDRCAWGNAQAEAEESLGDVEGSAEIADAVERWAARRATRGV